MHLFYAPDLKEDEYELAGEESRHCIKVLRLKPEDNVYLTDGRGTLYKARIISDNPSRCKVKIIETFREYEKRNYYLHIAIAPTKNIKRFEWFLEKGTELGIDEITPLLCFHSERKQLKTDRSNRIIESAMKQSLKTRHPLINEMTSFEDFLKKEFSGARYIASYESTQPQNIKNAYVPGNDALFLIGPEGDFSQEELEEALQYNYKTVSFGKSRLRTETAGIVACTIMNLMNS